MEFTLKDLIQIGVYVATVTGFIANFKYRMNRVEKSMDTVNKVVFLERGGLNVITKGDCSEHRDAIHKQAQSAVDQISVLNENIVIIMLDRGLKPVPMKPKTITKS